jgi:hypothetical protein
MKPKIKYSDEPMGKLEVVRDFLPPPDRLVIKENQVKVTISLSKKSVDFFKSIARQHHTSYQKMIRRVVDLYSAHYGTGG